MVDGYMLSILMEENVYVPGLYAYRVRPQASLYTMPHLWLCSCRISIAYAQYCLRRPELDKRLATVVVDPCSGGGQYSLVKRLEAWAFLK